MKIQIKKPKINLKKIKITKSTINNLSKTKLILPKISLRSIRIIIFKELYNFFTQPIGYIIAVLFIVSFIIQTFGINQYLKYGTNDLSPIFGYITFILAIAIPAITMSSISKEKQLGTIEFILTRPIRSIELALGKVIGNSIIVGLLLLLTIPFVLISSNYTTFDFGQIFMQYLGIFVLSIALVTLGVTVSANYKSEIGAFLTSLIISGILILLGSEFLRLPLILDNIISRFSLFSHYQSMSKGVLDIRDLIYFIAFILTFIILGFYFIKKDKYPSNHQNRIGLRNITILLIIITIFVGYFGQQIVGRIDITANKLFTLSDTSIQTINNVKDIVNVDFYLSSGLPLEYQSGIRSISNLLADYQNYSGGKLNLNIIDPNGSDTDKSKAQSSGLTPLSFTAANSTSEQIVSGYLGLVISYKDKKDTLEFVDLTNNSLISNPEYEVTKKIRKLTNDNLKKIAFVSNDVQATRSGNFKSWNDELSQLYEVSDLELNANQDIPTDISILVIAAPSAQLDDALVSKIKEFYANGKAVMLLTNTLNVSDISQPPTLNPGSLSDLFSGYGVTVNNDIVYDLESNNFVRQQGYLLPINYPYWIMANTTKESSEVLSNVNQISILWADSLSINKKEGNKYWDLIQTTNASNTEDSTTANLNIGRDFQYKDSDSSKILAEAIENSKGGRAIIVGDWKFLSEDFNLTTQADNLTFGISSIEWLVNDSGFAAIASKNRVAKRVILTDSEGTTLVIVSTLVPLIFLGIIGFGQRYYRNKNSFGDSEVASE